MMIFFEKSYTIPKVEISDLSLRDINSFTRVAGFVKYQNLRGDNLFVEFCSTQEFDDCIKLMELREPIEKGEYENEKVYLCHSRKNYVKFKNKSYGLSPNIAKKDKDDITLEDCIKTINYWDKINTKKEFTKKLRGKKQ